MQKRFGIIIFSVLLVITANGQQKLTVPEVDKTSYELYLNGQWEKLITYAETARLQGIDFFYLEARTGIAYYNLRKYRKASGWFREAWIKDHSFEWLQEYMYYSLLLGGEYGEAYKLAASFSPAVKDKIGYSNKSITGASVNIGYSFNADLKSLESASHGQQANVGDDYGEAYYLKNYHFETIDLSHRIAPSVSVDHSITYIGISRNQMVDWQGRHSFPARTSQFQYYISPDITIGRKWYVSPSVSLIWGEYSYAYGGYYNNRPSFRNLNTSFSDQVFSLSTWSHFGNFSPGVEYNYANISNIQFSQFSGWITVYPFSNLDFYITPRIYLKSSDEKGIAYNTFGVSAGTQVGRVHLYGQYLKGEMENFIESSGYVVSNFPGVSDQKLSGSLYFRMNKKYNFVIHYLVQDVKENYSVYSNYVMQNNLQYDFTRHTLTGGIIWNF